MSVLRRAGFGLLWGTAGYLAGAVAGALLVIAFSSNRYDRELEAAMTGAFFTGPLVATIAFAVGAWRAGPRRHDA